MRKVVINFAVFLFIAVPVIFAAQNDSTASELQGIWQGKLSANGMNLRIVFNINKNENGSYSATMDSPDQGVKGILVNKVSFKEDSLRLEVNAINGFYTAVYKPDSVILEGIWNQNGMSFPLNLKKTNKVEEPKRPQEPKKPYPYKEEEVSYKNEEAGITITGTFTTPKSGGKFPAVLLITGSGQQNRNEELMGHKPFLVLSDYLTKQGIAVLRVDDRGTGGTTGDFSESTTEDFVTDVLAGVKYLKSRKDVNQDEIGLVGHSEGGMIAPMAAVKSDDVDFIVLMAGPGVPSDKLMLMQDSLISKSYGVSDAATKDALELNQQIYDVLKSNLDTKAVGDSIRNIIIAKRNSLPEAEKNSPAYSDQSIERAQKALLNPWFRYFIAFNPQKYLKQVKVPVLAINGSNDLQVPAEQNLSAIEKALKEGGNNDYKIVNIPKLNHLFQTSETGSPSEYGKIEETISPKALEIVGDWILKTTGENQ